MEINHKTPHKIGSLILAGGLASRMNYCNKALAKLHDKPLIEYLIALLNPQIDYLAISANKEIDTLEKYGFPVFQDVEPWIEIGPLGGILSSINHFPANINLINIVPCDTPYLPNNLISKLQNTLLSHPNSLVSYVKTTKMKQPCILLMHREAIDSIPKYLEQKKSSSLKSWLDYIETIETHFLNEQDFINLNYLEDIRKLENA